MTRPALTHDYREPLAAIKRNQTFVPFKPLDKPAGTLVLTGRGLEKIS